MPVREIKMFICQILREKDYSVTYWSLPQRKLCETDNSSMNKGASSLHRDLTSLVTWAHNHRTICRQIPALRTAENIGHPSKGNSLLWMCGAGHAYYWCSGELDVRSREDSKGLRRRSGSLQSRKGNLDEKRLRLSERAEADAADTGPRSRLPGHPKDGSVCEAPTEPPARDTQLSSTPLKPSTAASSGGANTSSFRVMLESQRDPNTVSDEERCLSAEGAQEARVKQSSLAACPGGTAATVDLRRCGAHRVMFNTATAAQTPASAPTGKLSLIPAFIPKASASNQESLDSSFWSPSPPNLEWPHTETPIGRYPPRSESPKDHLQSFHISNPETKAKVESPASVEFFGFQDSVDFQEQLPSECGFSRNAAEHPAKEAEPLGSRHASHLSSSVSSISSSDKPPPASWSESTFKQEEKRNRRDIKVFKDWLVLHHPSEAREIHKLPPQDLNNYLASFYSSVKSQKGTDFSQASLSFFQLSIECYLKDHGYRYSVVKGLEFCMAREALKLRQQQLSQQKQEDELSILEGLTKEDVDTLHRKELLSKETPQGLLALIFINIIRGFGTHTHSRSLTLYWGQLVLRQDESKLEYLEWKDEPGKEVSKEEPSPQLRAKLDDPENCPVMHYKAYAQRRPLDTCGHYDPLYLTPRSLCSTWDQVWFCRKPLAKAKLKKIFSIIIQHVKGPG